MATKSTNSKFPSEIPLEPAALSKFPQEIPLEPSYYSFLLDAIPDKKRQKCMSDAIRNYNKEWLKAYKKLVSELKKCNKR